jgi:hypothetical protein
MRQKLSVKDCLTAGHGKSVDGAIRARGRVTICLKGPDGKIKDQETVNNLVVTVGRQHIADQMAAQAAAAMSHMGIGTGTTAVDAADTALVTEIDRNALTSKTQDSGTDANKVIYIADWAAGDGTGAITEAAIFNSASAGDMLCRTVFAVKNKAAGDTLSLTWILTFSA